MLLFVREKMVTDCFFNCTHKAFWITRLFSFKTEHSISLINNQSIEILNEVNRRHLQTLW